MHLATTKSVTGLGSRKKKQHQKKKLRNIRCSQASRWCCSSTQEHHQRPDRHGPTNGWVGCAHTQYKDCDHESNKQKMEGSKTCHPAIDMTQQPPLMTENKIEPLTCCPNKTKQDPKNSEPVKQEI